MKKRRGSKLKLNRETIGSLQIRRISGAASANCTDEGTNCTATMNPTICGPDLTDPTQNGTITQGRCTFVNCGILSQTCFINCGGTIQC